MKKFQQWRKDDIFLHYTGSMFGIGCAADSLTAIQKICTFKKRTQAKGLILLIPDVDWLKRFELDYEEDISRLLHQFWPGNVTFIFSDKKNHFPHLSVNGKITVRVPESKSLRDFIIRINEPIISTSINLEGETPLSEMKIIEEKFSHWFDYLVPQNDVIKQTQLPSTIVDVTPKELLCLREGEIPFSMLQTSYEKPKILFVCTANICRSPIAQYLLQEIVTKKNWNYRVASAGFLASGNLISENSRFVLEENGINAKEHKSTQLNEEIVQDSFLILTMTKMHKDMLLAKDIKAEKKTFTLLEFSASLNEQKNNNIDIDDPYGLDLENYRNTYQIIASGIDKLLPYLKKCAPAK
jgi:protein-tyrosine phosphatase